MKIVEALKNKEHTLVTLKETLGIKINEYPNYVVLNYDQISSPKFNPIVEECRGLILDKKDWSPLCRSFKRFYNWGEDINSTAFNFVQSIAEEKIDGSLLSIWFNPYTNQWTPATRSMAHAEGTVSFGSALTYSNLIDKYLGESLHSYFSSHLPIEHVEDYTYVCELVSPYTRIVTFYPDTDIYLLAIVNNKTGEEQSQSINHTATQLGFSLPKQYYFKTLEATLYASRNLPMLEEGYVCKIYKRKYVQRLKIKNPGYLAIAHSRNNGCISEKQIIKLVLEKNEEEYLQYFKEDRPLFIPYIIARDKLEQEIYTLWEQVKDILDQKEFALTVKNSVYKHILFSMKKKGTIEFWSIINQLIDNSKEKLILRLL